MWADINTKALQGSLFFKMRARLMGVDENYHKDLERLATHPDLLPQETQECGISDENNELLHKAEAIGTLIATKEQGVNYYYEEHADCSGSADTNGINGERN